MNYVVHVPLDGFVEVEIEAESEKEAIEAAIYLVKDGKIVASYVNGELQS